MIKAAGLILLIAMLAATSMARAAEPTVAFRGKAQVLGPEMSLGELAELSGFSDSASLTATPMGRSPLPGKGMTLGRQAVLNKLGAALPRGSASVSCPVEVTVTRAAQKVSREQLRQALSDALKERLGPHAEVEVSGFRASEEPLVATGDVKLEVQLPERDIQPGTLVCSVTPWVGGLEHPKVRLQARLDVSRKVLCATRTMKRGEEIEASAVAVETRKLGRLEQPLTEPGSAVGKLAARAISAGQVVCAADLLHPVDMKRGEAVVIVLESGPMRLTTRGVACQNGRSGDTIRVVNLDSKREIQARIEGAGVVCVPFGR
jgi:flagella basal body P-ring formation protein FlgA